VDGGEGLKLYRLGGKTHLNLALCRTDAKLSISTLNVPESYRFFLIPYVWNKNGTYEICETEFCETEICETEFCEPEICETEFCETEIYETEICEIETCETEICETEFCETEICETEICETGIFNLRFVKLRFVKLGFVKLRFQESVNKPIAQNYYKDMFVLTRYYSKSLV